MSPLKIDDAYRGAHATHVRPHRKLGKHRTVITEALPLVNWLIDDDEVVGISFGKLAHASGVEYKPRVECEIAGRRIKVLLVDKTAAQSIRVTAKTPELAPRVAARIKSKWNADILGTPVLGVVRSSSDR